MVKRTERVGAAGRKKGNAARKSGAATTASLPPSLPKGAPTGFGLPSYAIEAALTSDSQRALLEDYFGEAEYAELRLLASQATRATRGGPRVFILPGIMGSKLGEPGTLWNDVLWVDPFEVLIGRLEALTLPPPTSRVIKPIGVFEFAYEKLRLRLRAAGFDADFFPYDWRQDLLDLGTTLAKAIEAERRKVHLVAHSMGGLVARAACLKRPPNLDRIITLGTPHYGSYSPIQAFRGVHSTVNKIALLDLTSDPQDLARIFRTFPGLCEMLPASSKALVDYFDLKAWPQSGVTPSAALLKQALKSKSSLPEHCDGLLQIVGINKETVVKARVDHDEFVYDLSNEGDGTVPLILAELSQTTSYYVEEEHGSLANNKLVGDAVGDLLTGGKTAVLSSTRGATRGAAVTRTVRETELVAAALKEKEERLDALRSRGGASQGSLRLRPGTREARELLQEFASATSSTATPVGATGAVTRSGPDPDASVRAREVVVGRRRQRRLDITIAQGSLLDVNASAYALGIFSQVLPTGPAALLDDMMDGAISQLTARRMVSAGVGEVTVLPKGRHPLRPDFIALVGLGSFDTFEEGILAIVAENLVRTCVATRVDDFATVAFGGGSGALSPSALTSLMTGFLRGLIDADTEQNFRGITICEIDEGRYSVIRDELYRLCSTNLFDDVEVTLRERQLPALHETPTRRATARKPDPTYLIVREDVPGKTLTFECSVLSSGQKATVWTESGAPVPLADLNALLNRLPTDSNTLSPKSLKEIGSAIGDLVLPQNVRRILREAVNGHLVVIHDSHGSRIPWDAVHLAGKPLAGGAGLSHRYQATDLSIAKWIENRDQGERLRVLLAVNPTGDLVGAAEEGTRIEAHLSKLGRRSELEVLTRGEVTKRELLRRLNSGQYDVLHYSGHSFFEPDRPEQSGLILANHEVLTSRDLVPIARLPALLFFNSCQSARIRSSQKSEKVSVAEATRRGQGVAEAVLRGGIANFIGTYWPIRDNPASEFAISFYTSLVEGAAIGDAFLAARRAVEALPGDDASDWANYALYGNTSFKLRSQ